jgi:hypothetical protein
MASSSDDSRDSEPEFVDPLVQTRLEPESESVCENLVLAVAAVDGSRPAELPPLTDCLDPEALDVVLESTPSDEHSYLRFRYSGYPVYVTFDGIIAVFPQRVASH